MIAYIISLDFKKTLVKQTFELVKQYCYVFKIILEKNRYTFICYCFWYI